MRHLFLTGMLLIAIFVGLVASVWPPVLWSLLFFAPIFIWGLYDMSQKRHAILRNFPVLGNFRYFFELIRPEIYQYFVESDVDGMPFSRAKRSVVYQRAKNVRDTVPFGTLEDVYRVGYEWVNHSIKPLHLESQSMKVRVGGAACKQPYECSPLNVSAMSFGSLSKNAVLALSGGANIGGFAHNTGEGGISPYHLDGDGDLIWQIGTGYFGCRQPNGTFCPDTFRKNAAHPNVKMIEIKLSQGAKPGHGGILPAAKVTQEISEIRHVPMGEDVLSPPNHSAFDTPIGLINFISELRDLSEGKPIGFKLCVGKRREFLAICKAMHESGITPDFIAVDGGEGGTGAAPLEFSNHVGAPLVESLIFVHNALIGFSLRDKIRIFTSGKIMTGFDMVKRFALGADVCYSARAMMLSLGCVQALKCNTNHCPVGVATQNEHLMGGLVVSDKKQRVANYHAATVKSASDIMGAMGIHRPADLKPWHIMRRTNSTDVHHYGEIYEFLKQDDLLKEPLPKTYERACQAASAKTFEHAEPF
jgi:glutamate synthase domain-containing protein 2